LEELWKGDSANLLPSALDVMTSNQGLDDRTEDWLRRLLDLSEQDFRIGIMNYLTERCLLRTEGGYLGVSWKEAKPKDCVVLLASGRTPYPSSNWRKWVYVYRWGLCSWNDVWGIP
jgi:hypothetical protein